MGKKNYSESYYSKMRKIYWWLWGVKSKEEYEKLKKDLSEGKFKFTEQKLEERRKKRELIDFLAYEANFSTRTYKVDKVTVHRGQVRETINRIALILQIPRPTIHRYLKELEELGFISIKHNLKTTIITLNFYPQPMDTQNPESWTPKSEICEHQKSSVHRHQKQNPETKANQGLDKEREVSIEESIDTKNHQSMDTKTENPWTPETQNRGHKKNKNNIEEKKIIEEKKYIYTHTENNLDSVSINKETSNIVNKEETINKTISKEEVNKEVSDKVVNKEANEEVNEKKLTERRGKEVEKENSSSLSTSSLRDEDTCACDTRACECGEASTGGRDSDLEGKKSELLKFREEVEKEIEESSEVNEESESGEANEPITDAHIRASVERIKEAFKTEYVKKFSRPALITSNSVMKIFKDLKESCSTLQELKETEFHLEITDREVKVSADRDAILTVFGKEKSGIERLKGLKD